MDEQIQEWQQIWQKEKSKSFNVDELLHKLNKAEKTARVQRVFVPLLFALTIVLMLTRLSANLYNILSITSIGIGMFTLVIPLFRSKYSYLQAKENLDSQDFIKAHIKKLKQRMLIPKRYMLVFIIFFTLTLNIAFFGAFDETSVLIRTIAHLSTILLFSVLYTIRSVGIKRYNLHVFPLLEKLEGMIQE